MPRWEASRLVSRCSPGTLRACARVEQADPHMLTNKSRMGLVIGGWLSVVLAASVAPAVVTLLIGLGAPSPTVAELLRRGDLRPEERS